ncbi:hypothetical protein [Streptomyces sp. 1331.2]|uniref:hypothetical protein n=1 Tax=Streptomyces sp. 1331.2 TaxID=1938835 RepID=UPI000BD2329D|nr:hypothetical protein [Streptomyces sp. 1331.2]SOB84125.1 hypothetical protein SAMN06272789_4364 [Streptomyces sp. 1331.2]
MSEPSATPQLPSSPTGSAVGTSAGPVTPKSLLEQMQELLASVTADLAELRSSGARDAGPAAYPTATDTSEAPAAPGTR